jgi:hypothetical protein
LREVKGRLKALEERRKAITGPMNAALRSVNDLFRPPREKLEALEGSLKAVIAGYLRRREAENAALLAAAATTEDEWAAAEALAEMRPPAEAPRGVTVRQVWRFEVTDPDAVPRELCSPDPKKIGALEPGTAVAGVRWFQEDVVSARAQ